MLAATFRQMLADRKRRERHFPGLGDAAFTMLLQLGVSRDARRPESVSSLCIASMVPATTALRHLSALEQLGLVERFADAEDGRRVWLELSEAGVIALAEFAAPVSLAA
jgi:DNA-binding MarR family transcriptional regulator